MPHSDVAATTTTMTAQLPRPEAHLSGRAMDLDERAVPRSLKRHKVLPHPEDYSYIPAEDTLPPVDNLEPAHRSSASSLAHDTASDRMSNGELPPTPPGYSRSTGSSQSALPSSPTYVASPEQSNTSVAVRSSGTPPNQKSPPTPDVTPPARERRPKAQRPTLLDRFPSKATTDSRGGSRSESFRTAQEFLGESDDDERSTVKPASSTGARTPQAIPRLDPMSQIRKDSTGGVRLGSGDDLTPKTRPEFSSFDGDWASPQAEVEQEWDDNLMRNVTVRRRGPRGRAAPYREVDEEPGGAPLVVAKVPRSVPTQERTNARSSPGADRGRKRTPNLPSASETSASIETKRSSVMSLKSGTSTAVEAASYDSLPRRQKTLRHVKKQVALRDSIADFPANSTILAVTQPEAMIKQSRPPVRAFPARTESVASTGTMNSISSRKARRDVWKNGGIPVVIIPDRTVSSRSTRAPSLRSTTSSRQSRRSNSMSSAQEPNRTREMVSTLEPPQARSRRSMSLSGSSCVTDQLTMDYPPIVPRRNSSLSAPTSRNGSRAPSLAGSRAGSLTAESLRAHNAVHKNVAEPTTPPRMTVQTQLLGDIPTTEPMPLKLQPVRSMESQRSGMEHRANTDSNGDPFFGKRPTTFNTPFSQASVETNGTGTVAHSIADVAEARVVNIFPHQNKSVLMVHNGPKPTEVAPVQDEWQPGDDTEGISTNNVLQVQTVVKLPLSTQRVPVTPPQVPRIQMDDIDSPLRNPRSPPLPPAIQLIPATPSGLTPAHEKEDNMRDGYFPGASRRPSLVRRALGLRSAPENGTPRRISLLRALSISRNIRRDTAENPDLAPAHRSARSQYPTADDPPEDDTRLHPFWRPASQEGESDDSGSEEWGYDFPDDVDQVYVYPARRDRTPPRRRDSLSARLRSTFSILPVDDERHYTSDEPRDTDRRTIKRTPSGNLRVMRYPDNQRHESPPPSRGLTRRWSLSSSKSREDRPSTAPPRPEQRTWGPEKQVDDRGRRMFPGWQDKLQQMRPSSLQRRLSEHRRQKRTEVLRQKISGPQEVRDGVEDVVRKKSSRDGPSQKRPQAELSTRINDTVYDYPSKEEVWYGSQT